ncbi:MAG: hypothetical protein CME70_17240 [Halobacteriovorax sp.]|nr:hypothetical protein [Halobacteriovorax sp.]|tara:strand:+ start:90074 stop:90526 length:453 start_codon:yes stop_codon:yes gene_type:complete
MKTIKNILTFGLFTIMPVFFLINTTTAYAHEGGCKQVGELKRCEITVARYLTDLGKCTTKPSSNSTYYKYGYFSVGEKVLKQTWLEDARGMIEGSLSKTVEDDFKTIQTDSAWRYNSAAISRCEGKRDAYELRLESKRKIRKLIKDFLKR